MLCDKPPDHTYAAADDGGRVIEQFAKSHHGRELYHLQDDGITLAETQGEMTRLQKTVYLTAKAYWSESERDEAESSVNTRTPNKYV